MQRLWVICILIAVVCSEVEVGFRAGNDSGSLAAATAAASTAAFAVTSLSLTSTVGTTTTAATTTHAVATSTTASFSTTQASATTTNAAASTTVAHVTSTLGAGHTTAIAGSTSLAGTSTLAAHAATTTAAAASTTTAAATTTLATIVAAQMSTTLAGGMDEKKHTEEVFLYIGLGALGVVGTFICLLVMVFVLIVLVSGSIALFCGVSLTQQLGSVVHLLRGSAVPSYSEAFSDMGEEIVGDDEEYRIRPARDQSYSYSQLHSEDE